MFGRRCYIRFVRSRISGQRAGRSRSTARDWWPVPMQRGAPVAIAARNLHRRCPSAPHRRGSITRHVISAIHRLTRISEQRGGRRSARVIEHDSRTCLVSRCRGARRTTRRVNATRPDCYYHVCLCVYAISTGRSSATGTKGRSWHCHFSNEKLFIFMEFDFLGKRFFFFA